MCRHCREMLSVREGRRRCPRCRKRLDTLGIEDVDPLIAGLECPRCGKPTLAIESRVRTFKNKLVERLRAAPLPSDLADCVRPAVTRCLG
jgi:ssDNA-binding Zn-finger/Zn-ribbon topoisomerase 1